MHKRHHARRQHIIQSLDGLLYQLHTLSFILSPSIWSFIFRLFLQYQCSKPGDIDAVSLRSLRFLFSNILFFNAPSIWYHATQGAAEGRAIVLDFVGLAYVPSKIQLLMLDFLIIFLQFVLVTIAYETSILNSSTDLDTPDMLLPMPSSPMLSPAPSPTSTSQSSTPFSTRILQHTKFYPPNNSSEYVVDIRLAPIIARLRNPPPPPRPSNLDQSLPLPNTTPWPLPAGMRMLIRARAQMRRGNGGTGRGNAPPSGGGSSISDLEG